MNEITKDGDGFVGYEYKDITVSRSMEPVYADGYANFGWTLQNASTPVQGIGSSTMKFRRDRKIRNKAELGRLQRRFEACADEIESLERSKTTGASVAAYSIGIVGTAFMAGSVFAYLGGMLPLCIILAIPAFIGWLLPYFCFVSIRKKQTDKMAPLVDQKYDEIYEVCKKANGLLDR